MVAKKMKNESDALSEIIVKGIQEKKGKEIKSLNLKELKNTVCDYFIVCHGSSRTQVSAIADSVEDFVRKTSGDKPWRIEGQTNAEWILIDYVNVVVHIFLEETRGFYQLENLWADAEVKDYETII